MFVKYILSKIKSVSINLEFGFLKRRVMHYGYNLVNEALQMNEDIVIENVFKTGYTKSALLSYIIYPFLGKIDNNHSNHRECFTIAEILNELGYNVDVINWSNASFIPSKKYDLVIDNHNNLERLSGYFTNDTKKVFHATNCHWLYQNSIEYMRYEDFFKKTGLAIYPPRLIPAGNSAAYSDAISMFGNEFTKNSYGKLTQNVTQLSMSVTIKPGLIVARNYTTAKKKFLWLNSHGALLKGLDVVIDSFLLLPELELHICGNFENDSIFINIVSAQLSNAPNIKMEGWIDTNDDQFKKLVTDCAWVISTSFSEGGGGSILNCMATGLIPVISRSSSITLPDDTGYYLEKNNPTELINLVKSLQNLPDAALEQMSQNAYQFIADNHTLANFKNKYKTFLENVLQSTGNN
jgi:glycosyltransferase involved in cell wall biosynthesis